MFEVLKNIDTSLLLLINSAHTPFLDMLMWSISNKFIWIPLYLFFLFQFYQIFKKSIWKVLLIITIMITLSDGISSRIIKKQTQRYRPSHHLELSNKLHFHQYPNGTFYKGGQYGFVSSHAANSMAIAFFVWLILGHFSKWYWGMFIWALIVSYSRIYLGVHYPSDIIGGLIVGLFSASLSFWIGVKILKIPFAKQKYSNFEA